MFQNVVATAGVSLFGGRGLGRQWAVERASDLLTLKGPPIPELAPGVLVDTVVARWREHRPAITDPKSVSAEYSIVHALDLAERAQIVLLHSDTVAGELAAKLVADLVEATTSCRVRLVQISDLDPDRPEGVRKAFALFVHQLSRVLDGFEPRSTAFAPLGGFKVMTALGYLVGAYHGFPSVYLHEVKQIVHQLPPVPVRVDEDELREVADLVRRTRRHGASITDPQERRRVDSRPWLFERADDVVLLTAFGELLRVDPRYEAILQTRVRVAAPKELRGRERLVRHDVRELVRQLDDPIRNRGTLDHAPDFGHHGAVFRLFKGSSGQDVFRAAYRYDETDDVLDLRKIWFVHDDYERQVRDGIGLDAHDGDWTDVSEMIWGQDASP